MIKHAVKKLSSPLKYAPDQYKTHEICHKAVNTHCSTRPFVPECYKTKKICDKAFNKSFLTFIYIPDQYKLKKCETVLFLKILFQSDMFLINIRLNKWVMKLLMVV